MPASTSLIANIGTVISNGPSSVTQQNVMTPAGPNYDYIGNSVTLQTILKGAEVLLALINQTTDQSGDATNYNLLAGIIAALMGTGGPSSHLLTDIATVIASGPQGATAANALAASGHIQDWIGNCKLVQLKLQEAQKMNTILYTNTDAGTDGTNRTLLANVGLALS